MMQAGRDLDALVAEKVMGKDPAVFNAPVSYYEAASEGLRLPLYSTSIADAWLVVEKLRLRVVPNAESLTGMEEEMPIYVRSNDEGKWECGWELNYYTRGHEAVAETAPLAICKAALAAVGYQPA
jgi:hypothetical protein